MYGPLASCPVTDRNGWVITDEISTYLVLGSSWYLPSALVLTGKATGTHSAPRFLLILAYSEPGSRARSLISKTRLIGPPIVLKVSWRELVCKGCCLIGRWLKDDSITITFVEIMVKMSTQSFSVLHKTLKCSNMPGIQKEKKNGDQLKRIIRSRELA